MTLQIFHQKTFFKRTYQTDRKKETETDTERHGDKERQTQRDTERHREIQRIYTFFFHLSTTEKVLFRKNDKKDKRKWMLRALIPPPFLEEKTPHLNREEKSVQGRAKNRFHAFVIESNLARPHDPHRPDSFCIRGVLPSQTSCRSQPLLVDSSHYWSIAAITGRFQPDQYGNLT